MRVFTTLSISAIEVLSGIAARGLRSRHFGPLSVTSPTVSKLLNVGFRVLALLPVSVLLLAGWRDAPVRPLNEHNPANPWAPAPHVGYRSTIGPYKSRRPVEPAPWTEQNQRVAPQPKSGQ
jgi:hypothetical protein